MGTLFETGVKQYTEKFNKLTSDISMKSIEAIARSHGFPMEMLKSGLETNSPDFKKFCYVYASTLMPGRVSCCTYAAVVASIATHFGVPYKAYAGFCLQKSSARYAKDKSDWKAKRASGVEHPFFATHVYTEINGVSYESYNGDTSGIDHLDVVLIAEG